MKKIQFLFTLFILSVTFGSVNAATIDRIEAIDNNTIQMTANEEVLFSDIDVEGDVKLLKDIPVSFSLKDLENTKKVTINLGNDLDANTSYSLIAILGANGNIDFNIGESIEGEVINNNLLDNEEGLEKINILDSRTIELFFTNNLSENIFEFKMLSDITINEITSFGNNVLNLEVSSPLEESTSYILMILFLKDVIGNDLTFDEDLYDFTTPDFLIKDTVEEVKEPINEIQNETIILEEEGNIEEIALNSAQIPNTGTATSVLILLAIIANLAFFFRKKILK